METLAVACCNQLSGRLNPWFSAVSLKCVEESFGVLFPLPGALAVAGDATAKSSTCSIVAVSFERNALKQASNIIVVTGVSLIQFSATLYSPSCTKSEKMLGWGCRLMISPLFKQSFLLSSSTVFKFSTQT